MSETFWRGRRVLITGHTGFKGSWLSLWLTRMGAKVSGLALPPDAESLYNQARVGELVDGRDCDIRDFAAVEAAVQDARPEIVFHLAAQPLVLLSYEQPVETYATNVQGTVHVLDACRRALDLRAIVCVTSDKCYENREWVWPYRESDAMGGFDPYSSSKGAAELVAQAYRRSFFSDGKARLATARAGNVIGGGDWSSNRLIPDIVRALIAGEAPLIRQPGAIRPWQHVLDAIGGYLLLAERLVDGEGDEGWNFGPALSDTRPVDWMADRLTEKWGRPGWTDGSAGAARAPHEAGVLKLDCAKARARLGWQPAWGLDEALDAIVEWHRAVAGGADARDVSLTQLDRYRADYSSVIFPKGRE